MDWNIPLWILQIVMALAFLAFGYTHAFGYERARTNPRTAWMTAVPTNALRTIGFLEIAGAIGLILPGADRRRSLADAPRRPLAGAAHGLRDRFPLHQARVPKHRVQRDPRHPRRRDCLRALRRLAAVGRLPSGSVSGRAGLRLRHDARPELDGGFLVEQAHPQRLPPPVLDGPLTASGSHRAVARGSSSW